jgi:hypothetical protein
MADEVVENKRREHPLAPTRFQLRFWDGQIKVMICLDKFSFGYRRLSPLSASQTSQRVAEGAQVSAFFTFRRSASKRVGGSTGEFSLLFAT